MENEKSNDPVSKFLSRKNGGQTRAHLLEHSVLSEINILSLLLETVEEHGVKAIYFRYESLPLFNENHEKTEFFTHKAPKEVLQSALKRMRHNIPLGEDVTAKIADKDKSLSPPPAANEDAELASYILSQIYGANGRKAYFLLSLETDSSVTDESILETLHHCCQIAFRKFMPLMERSDKTPRITSRENEIIQYIAKGRSNPEIAEITGLSVHTINGYLRRIYLKTQTTNRVSLSFYALHKGLLL